MPAVAPTAEPPATQRQANAVPTGPVALGSRSGALAPAAIVPAGIVVVVTQPEEPDQPHDQQADVEDPEADHEDPPLGGHAPMLAR